MLLKLAINEDLFYQVGEAGVLCIAKSCAILLSLPAEDVDLFHCSFLFWSKKRSITCHDVIRITTHTET